MNLLLTLYLALSPWLAAASPPTPGPVLVEPAPQAAHDRQAPSTEEQAPQLPSQPDFGEITTLDDASGDYAPGVDPSG